MCMHVVCADKLIEQCVICVWGVCVCVRAGLRTTRLNYPKRRALEMTWIAFQSCVCFLLTPVSQALTA